LPREPAIWLRFYDPEGQLVLLPEEAAQQQAEQAQQQAQQRSQELENLLNRYRKSDILPALSASTPTWAS
jgi:hypothetical protein